MMSLNDAYELTAKGFPPKIVTRYYCSNCESQSHEFGECCGVELLSLSDNGRLNNEELYHYAELVIERKKLQRLIDDIDGKLIDFDNFDSGY